jgi:signal transduction histidine kinase
VSTILSQVRLLRQLSSEFSSFASSPTAKPEITDLGVLIHEVVAPYRMGLSDRIAVRLSVAPDLPSVDIDRTLFARAMTNVIENALHAMPGGGRLDIEVRLSASASPDAADQTITVRVSDTGVGMGRDALDRIFEPYFSTKATGTGLGLTIAKRNVELVGGSIRVESQRGVGTVVTIEIPAAV